MKEKAAKKLKIKDKTKSEEERKQMRNYKLTLVILYKRYILNRRY
jgi:uncharacterized membrane protein